MAYNNQYYQYPGQQQPSYQAQYQTPQQHYYPQQQQQQQQYPAQQPAMAQYNAAPTVAFPSAYTSTAGQPTPVISSRPLRTQTPHPHRRHTNAGTAKPAKSAMKKIERSHTTAVPLTRARTQSGGEARARLDSIARTRTNSSTSNVKLPDHIFLQIQPPNRLTLHNFADQHTLNEFQEHIFPMWRLGIEHHHVDGLNWHVTFSGSPWNLNGSDSNDVQRMICRIFWVLANQGYVYLTTINNGRTLHAPRLVFVRSVPDPGAHFFAMTMNNAGDEITFIDPPASVSQSLGLYMRSVFPRRIENDTVDNHFLRIRVKQSISLPRIDKDFFLAHVLKNVNGFYFKLDASVPLARKGFLGLGGRQELWVFKGSPQWWRQPMAGR